MERKAKNSRGLARLITAAGAALLLLVPTAWAETPPDEITKQATGKIIELLKANRDEYAKDSQKLTAMVNEHVLPHFDFRVMSKSVLGRYWREASEQQQARFVEEFKQLLVRTYATALLKYTNEEIKLLPFRNSPAEKTALVRTEVIRAGGGPPIPIHYSFYRTEAGWKVYDVVVDGVSLVTNYRSTYSTKIQRQGMDALLQSLAESNRKGEVDPSAPAPKGAK